MDWLVCQNISLYFHYLKCLIILLVHQNQALIHESLFEYNQCYKPKSNKIYLHCLWGSIPTQKYSVFTSQLNFPEIPSLVGTSALMDVPTDPKGLSFLSKSHLGCSYSSHLILCTYLPSSGEWLLIILFLSTLLSKAPHSEIPSAGYAVSFLLQSHFIKVYYSS